MHPAQKTQRYPTPTDPSEDNAWLDAAPVGREFGSADYERLIALDDAAFAAFRSWAQARDWMTEPNSQLDGVCPEEAARSPVGFTKVMAILMTTGRHASEDFMRDVEALPVQDRASLKGAS